MLEIIEDCFVFKVDYSLFFVILQQRTQKFLNSLCNFFIFGTQEHVLVAERLKFVVLVLLDLILAVDPARLDAFPEDSRKIKVIF